MSNYICSGHNPSRMRVCHQCKAVLFSDSSEHVCAKDYNEEERKCPTCRFVFSTKRNLTKHMTLNKNKCSKDRVLYPKPFKCHACGMAFTRARDIPRHIKTGCMGAKNEHTPGGDVFDTDTDLHIPLTVHRPKKPKKEKPKD